MKPQSNPGRKIPERVFLVDRILPETCKACDLKAHFALMTPVTFPGRKTGDPAIRCLNPICRSRR